MRLILLLVACTSKRLPVDSNADTAAVDTADTASDPVGLDVVLAALRSDLDAGLQRYSEGAFDPGQSGGGWPIPVTGGYLFVDADNTGFLAGDFNGWTPAEMTADEGFSYLVHTAARGDGYKFTDNGDDWHADDWSRSLTWDEFGAMSLVHPESAHLERLFAVQGQGLAARDLHVWVPESPDRVLFAMDGQNLFDPNAMWGGWDLATALGRVAPTTLVVGLFNTNDRMEEYTHVTDTLDGETYGGWGDMYADFVNDDVRPLTADVWFGGVEPDTRGLLGSSLGGLISYHIADRFPGEYSFAASMSGTMGWGSIEQHNETMIERYTAHGHQATALYLDSGGSGDCRDSDGDGVMDDDPEAGDNYCENIQLRDALASVGYAYETDLFHWWEQGAEHNEAAWADRVERPLLIFNGL